MSFSFGTQPAAQTGFGGGGFGQPASTTTGFGQPASTTGFGQPASTTGFGQPASTIGFGQPASTTGFGQPASTTGFGQPAASTKTTFGQTLTSTPFGQPASGTNNTTSLFGGLNTTGGFGNSTNQQQQQQSAFGTNNTTSLFGGLNTAGGFGNNANQQQQRDRQIYQLLCQVDEEARKASVPSITSDDYKPENVWQALALLKSWWDPKSPNCRFKHYFYNVVNAQEVHLYQKPVDQDQAQWDEAQRANPDPKTMVPALAVGFEDVEKRMDQQKLLSEAHNAQLNKIQDILKKIQLKDMLETKNKLADYKRKHMDAAQRVIKALKYTQVLRNKGLSITPEEEVMRTRLENIQDELQRSDQFHGKLSQLWAQLQLIKESGRKYGKIDGVTEWDAVDENVMRDMTKMLEEQDNGIQHVIKVIEKDTQAIDTIRKECR